MTRSGGTSKRLLSGFSARTPTPPLRKVGIPSVWIACASRFTSRSNSATAPKAALSRRATLIDRAEIGGGVTSSAAKTLPARKAKPASRGSSTCSLSSGTRIPCSNKKSIGPMAAEAVVPHPRDRGSAPSGPASNFAKSADVPSGACFNKACYQAAWPNRLAKA